MALLVLQSDGARRCKKSSTNAHGSLSRNDTMVTKYDSKDPVTEFALHDSRPYRLDEVGISGLAALLPHQRGDLPAVVDAVKRDVQRHVA